MPPAEQKWSLAYCQKLRSEMRLPPSSTNIQAPTKQQVTYYLRFQFYEQLWAQGRRKAVSGEKLSQIACLLHESLIVSNLSQNRNTLNTIIILSYGLGQRHQAKIIIKPQEHQSKRENERKKNDTKKQKSLIFKTIPQIKIPNI